MRDSFHLILDLHTQATRAGFKHILVWAPIPPVLAVAYFQPHYQNDPSLVQYAHRVLEGHPVELTFFFVPQVVQALRTDALGMSKFLRRLLLAYPPTGYVERFIFETAKISQLFCHQIIWNMKANTFKDDAAEQVPPYCAMLHPSPNILHLSARSHESYV
jgi:phosphatidylinositol 4-kinase A